MKLKLLLVIYIVLISYGCTPALNMNAEQQTYYKEISSEENQDTFSQDEIDEVWQRVIEFMSKYYPLKSFSKGKVETYPPDGHRNFGFIVNRVLDGTNYKVKLEVQTDNIATVVIQKPLKVNIAMFYDYLNTGELEYPELFTP